MERLCPVSTYGPLPFQLTSFPSKYIFFLHSDVALGSLFFSGGFFSPAVLSAAKLSLSGNRGGDGGTIFKVRAAAILLFPILTVLHPRCIIFAGAKKNGTYATAVARCEQPAVAVICSFYEKFYICPSCSLTRSR